MPLMVKSEVKHLYSPRVVTIVYWHRFPNATIEFRIEAKKLTSTYVASKMNIALIPLKRAATRVYHCMVLKDTWWIYEWDQRICS